MPPRHSAIPVTSDPAMVAGWELPRIPQWAGSTVMPASAQAIAQSEADLSKNIGGAGSMAPQMSTPMACAICSSKMWLPSAAPMREIFEKYLSRLQVLIGRIIAGGSPSKSE